MEHKKKLLQRPFVALARVAKVHNMLFPAKNGQKVLCVQLISSNFCLFSSRPNEKLHHREKNDPSFAHTNK